MTELLASTFTSQNLPEDLSLDGISELITELFGVHKGVHATVKAYMRAGSMSLRHKEKYIVTRHKTGHHIVMKQSDWDKHHKKLKKAGLSYVGSRYHSGDSSSSKPKSAGSTSRAERRKAKRAERRAARKAAAGHNEPEKKAEPKSPAKPAAKKVDPKPAAKAPVKAKPHKEPKFPKESPTKSAEGKTPPDHVKVKHVGGTEKDTHTKDDARMKHGTGETAFIHKDFWTKHAQHLRKAGLRQVKESAVLHDPSVDWMGFTPADIEGFRQELDACDSHDHLDPDESDVHLIDHIIHDDELETKDFEEAPDAIDTLSRHESTDITERVLSMASRRALSIHLRAKAPKMARVRRIKATLVAPEQRLIYRSRKAALMMIRQRVAGQNGKNYRNLQPMQKIAVDRQIAQTAKPDTVKRFSQFLLPNVRKKELARVARFRKNEGTVRFGEFCRIVEAGLGGHGV